MTHLKSLNFFATPEHSCSYLEDLQAKTLFADPHAIIATDTYSQLSELGFRRSGQHIYRPYCENCNACISMRIRATDFEPGSTQRRIRKKNSDLSVRAVRPRMTDEYYSLYARYINARHENGDMFPPSQDQFATFLVDSEQDTWFYEVRLKSRLVAVMVVDHLNHGLSAIYTFYDPDMEKRSLGTFAILWQIDEAARLGLEHLYLGYWVKNCRKMNYKTRFRPAELLISGRWVKIR